MSVETITIHTEAAVESDLIQDRRERLILEAKALGETAMRKYYHGTSYPLEIGDEIHPGGQSIVDSDGTHHASAATNENTAWFYANDKESSNGGRGRVYEVVPTDGKEARALGPQSGEVNSRSFTIVGQIDTMPDHQGTLPVDWSKQHSFTGANHPEDSPHVAESHAINNYVDVDPSEVPLPGLGDDYVNAELERMRVESGVPIM